MDDGWKKCWEERVRGEIINGVVRGLCKIVIVRLA